MYQVPPKVDELLCEPSNELQILHDEDKSTYCPAFDETAVVDVSIGKVMRTDEHTSCITLNETHVGEIIVNNESRQTPAIRS